jgi:hypothetical protein
MLRIDIRYVGGQVRELPFTDSERDEADSHYWGNLRPAVLSGQSHPDIVSVTYYHNGQIIAGCKA